jgi:hypothetical protein
MQQELIAMNDHRFIFALDRPRRDAVLRRGIWAHAIRVLAIVLFAALIAGAQLHPLDACASGESVVCGP